MTGRMGGGAKQADGSVRPEPTMDVENVARAVVYMDSLALDANVPFMTVMASSMPERVSKAGLMAGARPLTRPFRETVRERLERDPAFREAMLEEGVKCLLSGRLMLAPPCSGTPERRAVTVVLRGEE